MFNLDHFNKFTLNKSNRSLLVTSLDIYGA